MDKNIKNNLNVIKSHNLFSKNFLKNSVLVSASINYTPEQLPKLDNFHRKVLLISIPFMKNIQI